MRETPWIPTGTHLQLYWQLFYSSVSGPALVHRSGAVKGHLGEILCSCQFWDSCRHICICFQWYSKEVHYAPPVDWGMCCRNGTDLISTLQSWAGRMVEGTEKEGDLAYPNFTASSRWIFKSHSNSNTKNRILILQQSKAARWNRLSSKLAMLGQP